MPSLTLTLKYKIGSDLVISPSTLISEYLHGIPLVDQDGRTYSNRDIRKKIVDATTKIENYLMIKILPTVIDEKQDYIQTEWMSWGHIKCEYPINSINSFGGYLNDQLTVDFSQNLSLLTIRGKMIALVPGTQDVTSMIWFGNAMAVPFLRSGVQTVPNFWHINYNTGFTVIPYDVLFVICKYAVIQILSVLGDIVIGAGISSQSLSFDGLSQSFSSTMSGSGGAYAGRIKQYASELQNELPNLQAFYRGIIFETL